MTDAARKGVVVMVMILLEMSHAQTMPRQMTIAAIFDQGGDPKHELAFRHAVQSINRNRLDVKSDMGEGAIRNLKKNET